MTLAQGLNFERRTFHALFATQDRKEGKFGIQLFSDTLNEICTGMTAFAEKRKAEWVNK